MSWPRPRPQLLSGSQPRRRRLPADRGEGSPPAFRDTAVRSRGRLVSPGHVAVAVLAVAVAVALVALWPDGRPAPPAGAGATQTLSATVTGSTTRPCQEGDQGRCGFLVLRPSGGPEAARQVLAPADGRYRPGDQVRAIRGQDGSYSVGDFDRLGTLGLFAGLFGAVVVLFGRWHGVRALIGLGAALAVVALFMLPALLDGKPAALVALTGSLAVALITVTVTHGVGGKSVAALLGIAVALGLCVGLATLAQHAGHLVGVEYQQSPYLAGATGLGGLVIAGMVIAALGVLDDVTVSQASTVFALRAVDPTLGVRDLYHRAVAVGRDHVAATVNTLAFAYIGASLPALVIFALADVPAATALNAEQVAGSLLALLVGSVGLVCAVPATTILAALLAQREAPPQAPAPRSDLCAPGGPSCS